MERLKILKSKEIKRVRAILEKQYSYFLKTDYAYLENSKGKIFLVNKDIAKIPLDKLKTDRFGIYFAEIKHEHIRLSMEGAQLFAKEAKGNGQKLTNVIEFSMPEMRSYYHGIDINKPEEKETKHVLLSYNKEIFGSAKLKEGKILNFLPKIHRGETIF